MRTKFSFIMVSASNLSVRQIDISKPLLLFFGFISMLCFFIFVYVVYDLYDIKDKLADYSELSGKMLGQKDEITNQRKQIQFFAKQIDQLKAKLVTLHKFEKDIRLIANLEQKKSERHSLLGVGGSISSDLNTNINLENSHGGLLREMHDQVAQISSASIFLENDFCALIKRFKQQRNVLASTPAICPTKGWVSSKFGYRISPFTELREFHKGYDIAAPMGTPVVATAAGVIRYKGKKGTLGNMVVLDHGHGMITRYAHLSRFKVKRGKAVKRGDVIALVGNSGRSTGPHLHYEVRLNGVAVNPENYILD